VTLICGSVDANMPAAATTRAILQAWSGTQVTAFEWGEQGVALGVGRVDRERPASGPAPGRSEHGVTVVADARLDNRDELRGLLGLDEASDDTAILVAAWRRWGADCCPHLLGDFAFAIWDDATGQLFCGRDVVGAKALYYWAPAAGGFAFASQLAGLLAHPDVRRRLDRQGAAESLLFLRDDTGRTLFRDVHRLPPGHALTVGHRPSRPRTWVHTEFRPATLAVSGLDDWAEHLRDALERAVADRLPAGGRVAAHLSGGLDSSAVAGIAASQAAHRESPLVAVSFSAAPGSTIGDEFPVDEQFTVAMQERHGLEVHHRQADLVPFPDALRLAAPGMMPPPYRTSTTHQWAAGLGVDVMLSGWGGDEAASFSGRSHPADLLHRGRLLALVRSLHGRSVRSLWSRAVIPNLPDRVVRRLDRGDPIAERFAASIVSEPLAREVGVVEQLRRPRRTRATTRATQLELLGSGHLVERLEEWSADASRFGIDYRHPLLDQRVVAVALAAPSEAFVHDNTSRWLFRRAIEPYVPAGVAWRPDKKDSWTQQIQAGQPGSTERVQWVVKESERLLADGNDLGGVLDLAKLRRTVAEIPPSGYARGTTVRQGVPLLSCRRAVELAAFVEHNDVSVG